MAKNPHSHAEELHTRVELVRRYILRGIKDAAEIQAQFRALNPPIECHIRSIYRYISIVKEEGAKAVQQREGLNKDINELAWDLRQIIEEVSRELWKQYHAPLIYQAKCPHPEHTGPLQCHLKAEIRMQFGMVKVMALREIRAAAKEWVEMMQALGLAYKAPEKTQMVGVDGKPVDPTIKIDRAIISQEFVSFIKSRFQNPTGVKPFTETIDKETIPDALRPKTEQEIN